MLSWGHTKNNDFFFINRQVLGKVYYQNAIYMHLYVTIKGSLEYINYVETKVYGHYHTYIHRVFLFVKFH